jgi:hypothetical protein
LRRQQMRCALDRFLQMGQAKSMILRLGSGRLRPAGGHGDGRNPSFVVGQDSPPARRSRRVKCSRRASWHTEARVPATRAMLGRRGGNVVVRCTSQILVPTQSIARGEPSRIHVNVEVPRNRLIIENPRVAGKRRCSTRLATQSVRSLPRSLQAQLPRKPRSRFTQT